MYADDTAVLTHSKHPEKVAASLNDAMNRINDWLDNNQLTLNTKKTVFTYFTNKKITAPPIIYSRDSPLDYVTSIKYLGLHLDPNLNFKTHVKEASKKIKRSLFTFRRIRSSLSVEAAKAFFHAMIMSHFAYGVTCWSQTSDTTLKPLKLLYKQAAKILDRKDRSHHHCTIYNKSNILNFENFIKHAQITMIHKIVNGQAPPTLNDFVALATNSTLRPTCASTHRNCKIPNRFSNVGQSGLYRMVTTWNSLPKELKAITSHALFSLQSRQLLLDNQTCAC